MSVAIRAITRVQDADDAPALGAGQDGYALTWDNASGAFVATALSTGGLLATGATTGATSQSQTFTNGIIGPSWKPSADSTTALQLKNATGTYVLSVDTTNSRIGIGTDAPAQKLDVRGNFQVLSDATPLQWGKSSATVGTLTWLTGVARVLGQGGYDLELGAGGIGYVRLKATGLLGIGTIAPGTLLHGLLTSAATNVVTNVVTIGHDTSGTAAAGFGAGLLFQLESSTTAAQDAALIAALWYEATHATRKADLVLSAYDTAVREGLRIRGNGSEPAVGFYGVTPIARATLATGAGASVDDVITALQNLGLVKQS